MIQRQEYSNDTYLTVHYPWGMFYGGRAQCSDGVTRNLKRISLTADTFFSVPASVTVKGKTVAGYVSVDEGKWDEPVVIFHAYTYRKNGEVLPKW